MGPLEDYYSLEKCTFSKNPKRPREEIWENVTTIVLDFLLVDHNDWSMWFGINNLQLFQFKL
jgi:hypothetical protein